MNKLSAANLSYIIDELNNNKEIIVRLLSDLPSQLEKWKYENDNWCIIEVLCHLVDEEVHDFRARFLSLIRDPTKPFEPIDPQGWVLARGYIHQDLSSKLIEFEKKRTESINLLKDLEEISWENIYQHPTLGAMTPKMILTNWLAHDYLHIKQILRIKHKFLANLSNESLSYAGTWSG